MKKALLTLLAGVPLLATAQVNYTITGKVGNTDAPAKIFMRYYVNREAQVDSAVLNNGAFTLKGSVKDVTTASLIVDYAGKGLAQMDRKQKADVLNIYLTNGTTILTSTDSISHAKASGDKINVDYEAYKTFIKPYSDKVAQLNAWYSATPAETRKTKEFEAEIDKKSDELEKVQKELNTSYIKSHPSSYIALIALNSAGGSYPEYTEVYPLYKLLAADVKATPAGKTYAERLEKWKAVAIGAQAPEFSQADTLGKMVSLSSFKGKYLLIDFWASWCGPCRQENPNVVKAFNRYKTKNFTILGVSLDKPIAKDKWLEAIHKDGLAWTHVSDLKYWDNEVSTLYGVRAIPQNFLLDPNGKIIAKNLRGEDLDRKLAELLDKKI